MSLDGIAEDRILLRPGKASGNGIYGGIRDIIFVPPEKFSPDRAYQIAAEIGRLNAEIAAEGRHCLLIGPGRWGTSDRNLGVPVKWDAISSAAVIAELSSDKIHSEPSCGSHFFHNVTSLGLGYMTADSCDEKQFRREILENHEPFAKGIYAMHYRFAKPLDIRISAQGAIAALPD